MMRQDPPTHSSSMDQFEIDSDDVSFEPVAAPGFTGAIGSAGGMTHAPSFVNNNNNNNNNNNQYNNNTNQSWFQRMRSCFTLASIEKHFNVDTIDIQTRITSSILYANQPNRFRQVLINSSNNNNSNNNSNNNQEITPDLYGPVWITMTLVLFLAVTGNTSKYLQTDTTSTSSTNAEFEYDITHLTKAFSILTFYTFAIPSFLYVMMQCIHVPMGLVELISIYGYSLAIYVPTTLLCLVPNVMLEWMFLFIATVWSLVFVVRNVMGAFMAGTTVDGNGNGNGGGGMGKMWAGPICICLVACHFVFYLVIKLVFYHHRGHGHSGSGGSGSGGGGGGGDAPDYFDDGIDADDAIGNRLY